MRLASLIIIEMAAFALILGETYLFFGVVIPLGAVSRDPLHYTVYTLLKVVLTFGLGVLWFAVIAAMTREYVRTRVRHQTPIPSS